MTAGAGAALPAGHGLVRRMRGGSALPCRAQAALPGEGVRGACGPRATRFVGGTLMPSVEHHGPRVIKGAQTAEAEGRRASRNDDPSAPRSPSTLPRPRRTSVAPVSRCAASPAGVPLDRVDRHWVSPTGKAPRTGRQDAVRCWNSAPPKT
ncbi:hypothetical protein [Streptomyces sp. NPDC056160]|uniref:hypothetical protein n=1 Tax=Streptomyces sp. NPDC056160 TaxID=3345731 RepID=UPI0035D7CD57